MDTIPVYKIVTHQFMTLMRMERTGEANSTPLGDIVAVFQQRGTPVRFLTSDTAPEGTITFNLGVDLLSTDLMEEVLTEFHNLNHGYEIALISQVSMALIYGPHFGEMPGIAAAASTRLTEAGIAPLAVSASASSLSYLVPSTYFKEALETLTTVFKPPEPLSD